MDKIDLGNYHAVQIEAFDKDIVIVDNINNISFFTSKDSKYNYETHLKEENKILKIRKLSENEIIYISEDKTGNKLINYINLEKKIKEKHNITAEEEEKANNLKFIDLLIFNDNILIGYNYRIDIINYNEMPFKINSLKYFDFEITNMIGLSSNRIILGLYDSNKKESIIREHLLRIEDLRNNLGKFDCIGHGNLENEMIENIIKINESQILINIKNNSCIIFERKNEISEKLRKKLQALNKNELIKDISDVKINLKSNLNEEKNANFGIKNTVNSEISSSKQIPYSIISPRQQLFKEDKEQKSIDLKAYPPNIQDHHFGSNKDINNQSPVNGIPNDEYQNKLINQFPHISLGHSNPNLNLKFPYAYGKPLDDKGEISKVILKEN